MTTKPKPKTPAQQDYADKAARRNALKKVMDAAALEAGRKYLEANPDCNDLAFKPNNIVAIRRKRGTTKAILEIAKRMMYRDNENRTQAAILRDVQPDFSEIALHNGLWSRELPAYLVRKIEPIVNDTLEKRISLRGCKTLSQIRKKVKVSQQKSAGARSFKPEIIITAEPAIIIGKTHYSVTLRGSGEKQHPYIRVPLLNGKDRCWLRADGLAAALARE